LEKKLTAVGFQSVEEADESLRQVELSGGNFLTNYLKPWIHMAFLQFYAWAAE
jgi:hypothetical protein